MSEHGQQLRHLEQGLQLDCMQGCFIAFAVAQVLAAYKVMHVAPARVTYGIDSTLSMVWALHLLTSPAPHTSFLRSPSALQHARVELERLMYSNYYQDRRDPRRCGTVLSLTQTISA